ncbi:hypothetical protein LN042_20740 [Kitasatospora sp. RB6PN24]|uniref:hypothetical protein n=1 Tax=Kitasatospora humi TaxID=2893891 RepID=UPI001E54C0A9|nr:hypothetical protein [Kitasatospora humi]MCC9309475.1 hypothetical protein [Kitasatospora humi]
MDAILTSLIAVLGTLLGSTATHVFQQRTARRAELLARQERLRRERLDAYSGYAGLLVTFRQAMLHHWFCVHEDTDAEDEVALRRRSFETRSETQHALFQVQLITEDGPLADLAAEAFRQIGKIDRACDRDDVTQRRDLTQTLISDFVNTARRYVGSTQ